MLVDTHCHIHDTEFFSDLRQGVYERAREEGVVMICVGTSQADSRAAVEFAANHEATFAVIGVHPHDSKEGVTEIERLLREYMPQTGADTSAERELQAERRASPKTIVGIGEIGLDYYYDNSPRQVQVAALEQQLQWALDYKLPVSFHVREAYDDFWPIFDNFPGIRGVLHSFTDSKSNLEAALERGLYIGVNGISTFTKDESQKAMFQAIPLERMLLETDAPFLTPKPLRGKINEPVFVKYVAEHHAESRKVSLEDLAARTTANADELFKFIRTLK